MFEICVFSTVLTIAELEFNSTNLRSQNDEIQGRIIFLMREHANRHVTEEENDLNAEV